MGCGKTSCPDLMFDGDDASSPQPMTFSGFLQVIPEFTREELQEIRSRARKLSIPTSARRTEEERQYKKIADAANILDALYARDEQELGLVTITPPTSCGGCLGRHIGCGQERED